MRMLFCFIFLSAVYTATSALSVAAPYTDGECWNSDQCGENQVCSFVGYGGTTASFVLSGEASLAEDDNGEIVLWLEHELKNPTQGYGNIRFNTGYSGATWLSFSLSFESYMWGGENGGMGLSINIGTDLPSPLYGSPDEEGYTGSTNHLSLLVDTFSEDDETLPGDFVGLSVIYGTGRADVSTLEGSVGEDAEVLPNQLRSPDWVPVTFTVEEDGSFVFTYGSQSVVGVLPESIQGDIMIASKTMLDGYYYPSVLRDDQFAVKNVAWVINDADGITSYSGLCQCVCPGNQGCSPDGFCTDYNDFVLCGEDTVICYDNEECYEDATCFDAQADAPLCYEDGNFDYDNNWWLESCSYLVAEDHIIEIGDYTLQVDFKAPSYIFNDELEQTFLCARSNMDVPSCYGDLVGEDDEVRVSIPNVIDVQFPCHYEDELLEFPIWAFDAWAIPPVSGLASHVDLTFNKTVDVSGTDYPYWGFGLSHLYITRVRFNTEAEKILAREKYYGEIANRIDNNDLADVWASGMRTIPDVCDTRFANVDLVHDFWSTCANTWKTVEEVTFWNAQTPERACYCRGLFAPYFRFSPSVSAGVPSFPTQDAQYFWWFGHCSGCLVDGEDDPGEGSPVYLPSDNLDTDGDGVPNNCDLCDFFDDALDYDHDGVPDLCDKCEGFDDRVDINQNGIPDDCDLCNLAVVGCGDHATCTEGEEPQSFTCSCDAGYAIVGVSVDVDAIADVLASNYPSILAWANSRSDIISEDVEDNTFHDYEPYFDGTTYGDAFSFQFVLKSSLTRLNTDTLFQSFTDFLYGLVTEGCGESCSTLSFSYTWSQKVDSATQVKTTTYKLIVHLFAVEYTYNNTGEDGDSRGCADINECDLLGCVTVDGDNSATCYDSNTEDETLRTDVNERLCVCPEGYIGSRLLKGSFTQFPGCRRNPYA